MVGPPLVVETVFEPAPDRADVRPSGRGAGASGTMLGACAGVGVGISEVAVSGAVDPAVPKTLPASELALKVIPAINSLKSQLVALAKSASVVLLLKAPVAELKAGQAELTKNIQELSVRLTETRASFKVIDN